MHLDRENVERNNVLWKLVDQRDDIQLNNEYFRPGGESFISTAAIKSCLQTIIYLSYFEGVDHKYILLQGRRLINIKIANGRASLFWAVFARGSNCFQLKQNESFNIGEVKIQEHWKKTCRRLLEYLVDQTDEDQLQDGTPIINLILLSGKKYELGNNFRNLFGEFIDQIGQERRSETHVQLVCPYSEETSIDVAIRMEAKIMDLIVLKNHGGIPNHKTLNFWTKLDNAKSSNLAPHIPDPLVREDPYDSARFVHKAINKLLRNENDFIDEISLHFVPKWKVGNSQVQEAKITENVFIWVRKALENMSAEYPGLQEILKLSLSGSIAEGCRLKTKKGAIETDSDRGIPELDEYEIDLVLEAHLDVRILLSDADLAGCWLHHSHHNLVQQELCTIENKNPFRHVGNVYLNKSYQDIGKKDEPLDAQVFSDVIKSFVHKALTKRAQVPLGFDVVEDIQTHIRTTKSGIILDLSYLGRRVSIDIVSLIPMGRTQLKEVVRIFPGFDQRKLQFLQTSKLISNRDGIIAKDENWRLSFSNSESRVLRNLDNVLFKSLKYLASVSGLNIKTYSIKELTLAYVVHCHMDKCKKDSLMDSLLDLFVFSENNPISSPFYCSRLGSKSYKGCLDLFFKIILVHWTFGRIEPIPTRVRNSHSICSLLMERCPDHLSALELDEIVGSARIQDVISEHDEELVRARSESTLVSDCATVASNTPMQQLALELSSSSTCSTGSFYSEPTSDYETIDPDLLQAHHQQQGSSFKGMLSQLSELTQKLTDAKISIHIESNGQTFNFSNENQMEEISSNAGEFDQSEGEYEQSSQMLRTFRSSIRINMNKEQVIEEETNFEGESDEEESDDIGDELDMESTENNFDRNRLNYRPVQRRRSRYGNFEIFV